VGEKKRLEELAAYKAIYSKLDEDIPLVCVCGNHDVGNKPTEETIDLYRKEFGDDYLTFWAGGVKFIVLNSQLIQGPEGSPKLAQAHANWLEGELRRDEKHPVHTVVCCHIAPFCWDVKEQETNFNWPFERRKMWLDKFVDAGVLKMYCAHYHRNAGGSYRGMKVLVAGPIGTYIRTKDVPDEFMGEDEESRLKAINFKLSRQGFKNVESIEETSGLYVCTVTKEGINDQWLNVAAITKEING